MLRSELAEKIYSLCIDKDYFDYEDTRDHEVMLISQELEAIKDLAPSLLKALDIMCNYN